MSLQRVTRNDARVRAPRFKADAADLVVESKTIGTDVTYTLSTEDFSRSGLLLHWNHRSRMPFLVNTILELRIDPSGTVLDAPVACLAKVVRRKDLTAEDTGVGAQIGVQIIQIETDDLTLWEKCLAIIEKRMLPPLAPVPRVA